LNLLLSSRDSGAKLLLFSLTTKYCGHL